MMAEIVQVFGKNFQEESQQARKEYILNQIANNVAHRQLNFHLTDTQDLWNAHQSMSPQNILSLEQKIYRINPKMYIYHLNKQSNKINMLPTLIINQSVEYFMIIDIEMNRAYFIYITPTEVTAY